MKPIFVIVFVLLSVAGYSTHLRGGQIRLVSASGLKCFIELRLLANTASEILPGEGILDFGDGETITTSKEKLVLIDADLKLGVVVYLYEHTYPSFGTYLLSYNEPNLTGGILNLFNSVETRFYIESEIALSANGSSPSITFPTDPVFTGISGRDYMFSTAAIDDASPNDFFYTYELPLTPPIVKNYQIPKTLTINRENGLIRWDTKFSDKMPETLGQFWLYVKVNKYSRKGIFQASVSRALVIDIWDVNSEINLTNSVKDENGKVLVADGKEKKIKVVLSEVQTIDSLYFDVYFNKTIKNNISIATTDSTAGSFKFKIATITLKTTTDIVSDVPYPVTVVGNSKYRVDFTFLYQTKDPPPDLVVTGLFDEEPQSLKAYPNPFHSELYVEGESAVFINNLGHTVMDVRIQEGEPINTSKLLPGVYILQVGNRRSKVVRQ